MKKSTKIIIIVAAVVIALAVALTVTLVCVLRENPDIMHTVTFNSNGGTEVASLSVPHNGKIEEPVKPIRLGYTFDGWYKDGSFDKQWRFNSDRVTEDITLYAKWSYDATEGLKLELVAGGQYTVVGIGTATDKVIVVPAAYQGLPVTSIANKAFMGNADITAVVIPDSITSIGSEAFRNCGALNTVVASGGSLLLGESVFRDCVNLEKADISSRLSSIPQFAFSGCKKLRSFAFSSGLKTIEWRAFYECEALADFVLPTDLETIGAEAFSGCKTLTSVTVTQNVREIGVNAFSGCSGIASLNVARGNVNYYSANNCIISRNKLVVGCKTSVIPDDVTTIGAGAFQGCQELDGIVIPSSVITIEKHAFSGCVSLTIVRIPTSVQYIGDSAFEGCSYLATFSFSDIEHAKLQVIGREAFAACTSLSVITLPKTLTKIGVGAFWDCEIRLQYYGTTADWSQIGIYSSVDNVDDAILDEDAERYGSKFVNVFCRANESDNAYSASVITRYLAYNDENVQIG